ncbi:uncharacterized protein B0I36DRAFT_368282 [Microdochium trichocladiopsis]|uniref:Uncharacterized protein n=1 Tax=Microdochium trichocladiopsis TaxID=1682393 RepID=A0A9P8XWF2_9PEZI|nr:uncharacterized protein B0I36DRAFT_368282 [Microdochium trichocladiopsis]KAH7018244.1 hypothetical protein B0I36DRAFT_368282 [Microdochium trichocladiopsis]
MAPSAYNLGRQYTGPGPQQWNPQWGPPPPQQGMPGPAPMGGPYGAMSGPPPSQQFAPGNAPSSGAPVPQSGPTPGPVNTGPQQAGPVIQEQGFRGADAAAAQTQQSPPPAQNAQFQPPSQPSQPLAPTQFQGLTAAQRPQGALPSEPSQSDESPTIAPQVAVPVAGAVSPPAQGPTSPPVDPSYNVSPPVPEEGNQGRSQPKPMTVQGAVTPPTNASTPHNVPVPDSATTFSPVNPAASRLPNPPPPTVSPPDESGEEAEHSRPTPPPQHRLSDIRLMSSKSAEASEKTRGDFASPDHADRAQQQNGHSGLLAARAMSMSPPQQQQPGPGQQGAIMNGPQTPVNSQQPNQITNNTANMNINVAQANGHRQHSDDYYDATPRKPPVANQAAQQQQQEPPAHKHKNVAAAVAVGGAAGVMGAAGAAATVSDEDLPPNGTANGSQDHDRDAEEKQVVEEAYELPAVNDNSEDLLVMSATSYPGQEWNPYGAGEFGDYD